MPSASRNSKAAPEVRESIEAKGSDRSDEEDAEMEDAGAEIDVAGGPARDADVAVAEDMDVDAEAEAEADADGEADPDIDGDAEQQARSDETKNLLALIEATSQYLCNYKEK